MNVDNINRVAAAILTNPEDFNMRCDGHCIAGFCEAELGTIQGRDDIMPWDYITQCFGIDEELALLMYAGTSNALEQDNLSWTPFQAAAMLHYFVATGEINWHAYKVW